jgi:hypothetical protein
MTNKEKAGLRLIYSHSGKKRVYESYKQTNPDMAQKYLEFIAKNQDVQYIMWNNKKKKFTA